MGAADGSTPANPQERRLGSSIAAFGLVVLVEYLGALSWWFEIDQWRGPMSPYYAPDASQFLVHYIGPVAGGLVVLAIGAVAYRRRHTRTATMLGGAALVLAVGTVALLEYLYRGRGNGPNPPSAVYVAVSGPPDWTSTGVVAGGLLLCVIGLLVRRFSSGR